ncbi:hypothetical protein [Dactylosporangium salmoneum]|uniref:Uncharacterized protein n=1 Tax=Dactylosporangium salmoneum TaxID=53361 RepID=A0ABN3H496_9ACTN
MDSSDWAKVPVWPTWRHDLGCLLVVVAIAAPVLVTAYAAIVSFPMQDATAADLTTQAAESEAATTLVWFGLAGSPFMLVAGVCLLVRHYRVAVRRP